MQCLLYLELALWQRQFPKTKAQQSPFNIQTTSGLWETTVSIDCIMTWPEGEEQQNRFIIRRDSHTSRKSCTVCPLKRFIMKVSSPKRGHKKPFTSWQVGPRVLPRAGIRCLPQLLHACIILAAGGQQPKSKQRIQPQQFLCRGAAIHLCTSHSSLPAGTASSDACSVTQNTVRGPKPLGQTPKASPGAPLNQGTKIWPFSWHPQREWEHKGQMRRAMTARDWEAQQKGFVSPQRGFVVLCLFALPWHAHKQHLHVCCFRLTVKSHVKHRTALIGWEEAMWNFF